MNSPGDSKSNEDLEINQLRGVNWGEATLWSWMTGLYKSKSVVCTKKKLKGLKQQNVPVLPMCISGGLQHHWVPVAQWHQV